MSIARKITSGASGGSGGSGGYVDDVFSTYLYEGTGADRDIVNGIDLADKGGLVWLKPRTTARPHTWFDTERGVLGGQLQSNSSNAELYQAGRHVTSFNEDGFTIGLGDADTNAAGTDYASWTFAKQEGFFDIVTYTGDGVAGREIPHNLGSEPGMIIVKSTTRVDSWAVYHRSMGNQFELRLDKDFAKDDDIRYWNYTDPTDTVFTVGVDAQINGAGFEYVAYLFAHDAPMFGPNGDESIIKCGSYEGNGSKDGPEIDLGWEPQWLLIKDADGANNWIMQDMMRGITTEGNDPYLHPNTSSAETGNFDSVDVTATGFKIKTSAGQFNDPAKTHIYMAIRRPNKPAKEFEPDELFAMDSPGSTSGAPKFVSGFPVDMAFFRDVDSAQQTSISTRMLGAQYLQTNDTSGYQFDGNATFDHPDGFYKYIPVSDFQAWMFKRAPGFFDVVTQVATSDHVFPHSLGVPPEMIWLKASDDQQNWSVYAEPLGNGTMLLNTTEAYNPAQNGWLGADTTFTAAGGLLSIGRPYAAFLWASVPGLCDIGSYTGTSADLDIDCGFTNGARFVLIKRTDWPDSWHYFDTLRGISSGGDGSLFLDSTAPQQTSINFIDPLPSGFTVKGSAGSGVNSGGGNYLYMAIA